MSLRARATTELLVRLANRPGADITVEGLRALVGPPSRKADRVRGVVVTSTTLGGVPGERYEVSPVPAHGELLALHGGGFIAGTASHFRSLFAAMARSCRLVGTSLDYRLAPEHPFPAAVDDGLAAYRAMLAGGVDPASVVVTGESAGAAVALSTVFAAHAAGLPAPRALVLWWPMLDLTAAGASIQENAGRDFLTARLVELSVTSYLAGFPADDPLASPLHADDDELAALPPVHLQVGERDLLRSDAERFAERLRRVGVPVSLHLERNAVHGFASAGDGLPESRRALARVSGWLERLPSA